MLDCGSCINGSSYSCLTVPTHFLGDFVAPLIKQKNIPTLNFGFTNGIFFALYKQRYKKHYYGSATIIFCTTVCP
jgi:hypothetical protein